MDPRTTALALAAFAQQHIMQQQQLQQLHPQPNQLQFLFQVIKTVLVFHCILLISYPTHWVPSTSG